MELREFVKSTLLDVMGGIKDAQSEWNNTTNGSGAINPVFGTVNVNDVQHVSFDVAVTAETATAGKGNAGIKVWSVGIGGELSDSATNSSVSRIQFKVPVMPPVISIDRPGSGPLPRRRNVAPA
jgi:hypothetical protein